MANIQRSEAQRTEKRLQELKKIFEARGKPISDEMVVKVHNFLSMLSGMVVENYLREQSAKRFHSKHDELSNKSTHGV